MAAGEEIDYKQITANVTSTTTVLADVAGLSITYSVPVGSGPLMINVFSPGLTNSGASGGARIAIIEDSTQIGGGSAIDASANSGGPGFVSVRRTPTAGSHTWKVQFATLFSGTATLAAGTGNPGPTYIQIVEV